MKNRVKISIDGKGFTIMGEETAEHMQQVAAYIDQKMAEVRGNSKAVKLDSSLAYVLTSINVADDYFKEKAYAAELEGRLIGMTARLQEATAKLAEAEARAAEAETAEAAAEAAPEAEETEQAEQAEQTTQTPQQPAAQNHKNRTGKRRR